MSHRRFLLVASLAALALLLLPLTVAAAQQTRPPDPSAAAVVIQSVSSQQPMMLRLVPPLGPPARIAARVPEAQQAQTATASFVITFLTEGQSDGAPDDPSTCHDWPANAQAAFTAAANTWATLIRSTVPIRIKACWADLPSDTTLGYGWPEAATYTGGPFAPNTVYAYALADAMAGGDIVPGSPDMHTTYNTRFAWYFGTDGKPSANQVDFVSVVMHEIAHGLNFRGSATVSNGQGSWGYGLGYPDIYDTFVQNGYGQSLLDTALFPNGTPALAAQLTGNNLFFTGANARAANGNANVKIYAPNPWVSGSSYSHLDWDTFHQIDQPNPNRMMVWAISDGDSIHDPGPVGISLLKDLGWVTNQAPTAVPDAYQTAQGTVLAAASVLANDLAGQGPSPLTAEKQSDPAHGALVFNSNGTFTYTPVDTFYGGDSFTYRNYNGAFYSADARVDITVNRETTPPVTTITLNPSAPNGQNGWYTSAVQLTVSATDPFPASGLAETRCVLDPASPPTSFDALPPGCAYTGGGSSVGADGEHTLYAASMDNAGNKETVQSAYFKIDATPPQINIITPVDHAAYPPGLTVRASYTCNGWWPSPIANCSGMVDAGDPLDTATAGYKTFVADAVDEAGNWATATAAYWVLPATPGPVVAWGWNANGQIDVPDAAKSGVTAIAGGDVHSLALKSDGTIVAWGWNGYGQTDTPPWLSGVSAIAAGAYHNLALRNDGSIVVWGHTEYGEADLPAGLSGVTAIDAGWYHNVALKADGTVVAWGLNNRDQIYVPPGLSRVIAISAGGNHSLALKSDGTVVTWGDTDSGVDEVPEEAQSGVTAIATGANHSLALKSDGTVVAWGDNTYGQLDVPFGLSGVTAIATTQYHSLAQRSDGTVVAWGAYSEGQSTVPASLRAVSAIAAGGYHSLAIGQLSPIITVDPASLSATLDPGDTSEQTLTINNTGGLDLVWQIPANSSTPDQAAAPKAPPLALGPIGGLGRNVAPAAAPLAPTDTGYAYGWLSYKLGAFPLNDYNAETDIGYWGERLMAMDFDANAATLYGLGYDSNAFGRFDLSTGGFTTIATSTPLSGHWTGMAIDPVTNEAYASSGSEWCDAPASLLYRINLATGAPMYVGDMGLPCVIDIAIGPTGAMYAHDIQTDSIYRIDRTTAHATLIGPTGYDADWAQGMDFDNEDGRLYVALLGDGPNYWGTYYGTVDLATGHVTLLSFSGDYGTTPFQATIAIRNTVAPCTDPADAPWLSVEPASGTTAPGCSSEVEVTLDSAGLAAGSYTAHLCVNSNDPVRGRVLVLATLVVNPAVTPTDDWASFSSYHLTFAGVPAPVGAYVSAYDPQGKQCGERTTEIAGSLAPPMACYGDDSETAKDEGPVDGDLIAFKVNGIAAAATARTLNGAAVGPGTPIQWHAEDAWVIDLAQAAQPALTIMHTTGHSNLSWHPAAVGPATYEMWRSDRPYFNPAAGEGAKVATVPASPSQMGWSDTTGVGDPNLNVTYRVLSKNSDGTLTGASQEVGEFDFTLTR